MRPTEVLMQEHEAIKLVLRILGEFCDRLESAREVPIEHLDQVLEFNRVFADRCHHGKEQDLLFPAMEEAGVPSEGGPIGVMLAEHDMGRGFVAGMVGAIGEFRENATTAFPKFVENARNYIALLTEHIEKENTILYPIADVRLSEKTQEELLEQFEKVEHERIGPGKHEEFHALIDRLEETYL